MKPPCRLCASGPAPAGPSRAVRGLLAGLALAALAEAAHASERAVVLVSALGAFALTGGALAGLWAALRPAGVRILPAFLVYLGLLGVAATTRAQSMDALPLALVFGAAVGVLPFAAAYWAVRTITLRLKRPPGRRDPPR